MPARGNGTVLYEVSNRGGKGMVGFFNFAAGGVDPQTAEQFGDGFLLENGFTLLWVGWQFDVPVREGLVRVFAPIAKEADGRAITGLVRSDFVVNARATEASLADRGHQAYVVSDRNDAATVLTVRDSVEGARRTIPRTEWQFTEDGKSVRMAAGFEPQKIYEVVYRAQDPPLVGVGPAAVRDTISKIKYSGAAELGLAPGAIKRGIAFGISQSGRFLRTYLYYGFNEDESHRKVFDGVMPHVAGSGRGSFNHRFAQPSRDGHPYINFFYPTDIFPFTDAEQSDPETGLTDGLLTHATKPAHQPNIFYTNSSYEYWGRSASLFHTTVDGTKDARLPANVRGYLLSAGQHGVAAFPPSQSIGQQLNNPLDYRWAMRSLLLAMNRWVTDGTAPPASALPRVDNGTLVTLDKLKFPKLPAVNMPVVPHEGVSRRLRPGLHPQRHRHAGAACDQVGVRNPGAAGGRRRQRAGRHPHAGAGGAGCDLHRLEPVQREVRPHQRGVEHAGVVHSAGAVEGRSRRERRSAAVDRGALSQPRSVSRRDHQGRQRSRDEGLSVEERCAAHCGAGWNALGLRD